MENYGIYAEKVNEMVNKAQARADAAGWAGNSEIHLGVDRRADAKLWEKGDKRRAYINIRCYSSAGNYKGQYKCGYVDLVTGEYIVTKYDDIDLTK